VKRFWDDVSLAEDAGEFRVLLDGKAMHLPNGGVLRVGPPALAAAIAEEWRQAGGQKGGEMSYLDTPLTRVAGTARTRSRAMARRICFATGPRSRANWRTGKPGCGNRCWIGRR